MKEIGGDPKWLRAWSSRKTSCTLVSSTNSWTTCRSPRPL